MHCAALRSDRPCTIIKAMASTKNIFDDALGLPATERARLARRLLVSLDESEDPRAAEAWLTEIERRLKEVEDGTAQLEDWGTVRERLASRWKPR